MNSIGHQALRKITVAMMAKTLNVLTTLLSVADASVAFDAFDAFACVDVFDTFDAVSFVALDEVASAIDVSSFGGAGGLIRLT